MAGTTCDPRGAYSPRKPSQETSGMARKIGVIGSGTVGETLANGFLKHGYEVMRGSRSAQKLGEWQQKLGPRATIGSVADTAKFGEIIVLAVKGSAAEDALKACKPGNLEGKTVIDVTNPIADKPPDNGVLALFTTHDQSLLERLQKQAPKVNFVKAFSRVGAGLMVDPDFGGQKPTMFI